MGPRIFRWVAVVLALVATIIGFGVLLVAWSVASLRCPGGHDTLAYVPLALVIIAGLLGSAFLTWRRPRPVIRAAAWGMLVGWALWAVLAISTRELPAACGLNES